MARETKAQMEARIKAEVLAEVQAKPAEEAKPKGRKVSIPAWAASAPQEVIGIDTTTGNPYVCVARRDGESSSPKIATGGAHAGVGPAKARRISPDTLAYILDHEAEMRKLIETCGKLKPSA
jgi:hypothetical protein